MMSPRGWMSLAVTLGADAGFKTPESVLLIPDFTTDRVLLRPLR